MKKNFATTSGFTLVELMCVLSVLLITTTVLYRFYHEAYLNHGSAVQQEMARLRQSRVFMGFLEKDLQRYESAATSKPAGSVSVVTMPASGPAAVSYRLEPSGVVIRDAEGTSIALLEGITLLQLQPHGSYPGLYSLQLTFEEPAGIHPMLGTIYRVLGFPSFKQGTP